MESFEDIRISARERERRNHQICVLISLPSAFLAYFATAFMGWHMASVWFAVIAFWSIFRFSREFREHKSFKDAVGTEATALSHFFGFGLALTITYLINTRLIPSDMGYHGLVIVATILMLWFATANLLQLTFARFS